MVAYIIRRLMQAAIVVIIVSLLVFIVIRLLPGDPVLLYLAQKDVQVLTQQQIEDVRHQFGLDKPLMLQYINWVSSLFRGEFGTSLFYRENVGKLLAKRIPVTLHLGLSAFVVSGVLGIFTGLLAALRRGKWLETVVTVLALDAKTTEERVSLTQKMVKLAYDEAFVCPIYFQQVPSIKRTSVYDDGMTSENYSQFFWTPSTAWLSK